MTEKRSYVMRARATAVEDTRRRILEATIELGRENRSLEIVLRDVADRAGVSVQTVLRHFGSRDGVFEAALEFVQAEVLRERGLPERGDLASAVGSLVDEYEDVGDWMIVRLGQENDRPMVRRMTDTGRAMHRRWVRAVLTRLIDDEPGEALVDLTVVATDVYTWKLLRRDRGLGREETEERIHTLVTALLAARPPE